ncbi:hypothetical protein ACKAV7_005419 [Fusarium commune]
MTSIESSLAWSDDILPPEGQYESREKVREAINAWARPRGYAFSIQRSRTDNGRGEVVFSCDRGAGRIPSLSTSRETKSRRNGCLFSVTAKEERHTGIWHLKHRQGLQFRVHNHEPSLDPTAHPVHRQLSTQTASLVHSLSDAGIAPKKIRSYMRLQSDTIATQRDIYNCIAAGKRALAEELNKQGFWSHICLDESDTVTAVIFSHPDSLAYLEAYPEVLIMDCTYKPNKYRMPLLDIVGVDACEKTFCVAFAFLSGEEEEDFKWALSRLRSLFDELKIRLPSVILTDRQLALMNAASSVDCFPDSELLLCLWHVNTAVLANCMNSFTRDKKNPQRMEEWKEFERLWKEIIFSPTQEIYYERLQKFREHYEVNHLTEIGYLMTTWLNPHKQKFVRAWTDRWLHFGQYVTSRCEGIHHQVKSDSGGSQGDLFETWRVICRVVVNQLSEVKSNQAQQHSTTTNIRESKALYDNIRGWVSHEAILKLENQRERLKEEVPDCTGVFTRTQGLPCAHQLIDLMKANMPIPISKIHSHWRYRRPGHPQPIIQPRKVFDRLILSSTIPATSTQREPSQFELVEKANQQRKPPTCSTCGTEGHRRNSKECPQRYSDLRLDPAPVFRPPPQDALFDLPYHSVPIVTMSMTTTTYSTTTYITSTSPVTYPSPPRAAALYDSPLPIYERYKAARQNILARSVVYFYPET